MKARKTYGINGLLEWHGTVSSHGVRMKVDFTNGSVTAYGVSPATFTTSDPFTQHVIENSEQFASGRIRVERSVALPGGDDEPQGERSAKSEETPPVSDSGDAVTEVAVSDKLEAVEWLKEHYPEKGYTSLKLRSKSAFDAACKECGVEFRF